MKRRRPPLRPRGRIIPGLFVAFVLGGITGWLTHARIASRAEPSIVAPHLDAPGAPTSDPNERSAPAARVIEPVKPAGTTGSVTLESDAIAQLQRHSLRLPIDGADVSSMKGSFSDPRRGKANRHEAVDILAPRDTPIRAVEDGKIAKLFLSKAGGITIYQFDPSERFCYYYAHLDRYASGLHDGQLVAKGEVIGYVGTTGNAPANTPHLHFAVYQLDDAKKWWKGMAIDPYLVFKR